MIEIYKNLYIGDENDFKRSVLHGGEKEKWAVVHACKEPYHRDLLGYTDKGAPKNHPEYLTAIRGNTLFLNLIDADSSSYIPEEIIKTALLFIDAQLTDKKKVLVHCNRGESRGPTIGLLYLTQIGMLEGTFGDIEKAFKKIYPNYFPGTGMRDFAESHLYEEYL